MAQFRRLRVLVFPAVCITGCGEDVFSSLHVLRVTPTLEVSEHASQCSSLDVSFSEGSSVSGIAAPSDQRPDFWFEERSSNDGVAFTFGSGSATREEKLYRNLFYETHKLDRFVVESLMGDHYVVTVWGDTQCDTCAPGPRQPWSAMNKCAELKKRSNWWMK